MNLDEFVSKYDGKFVEYHSYGTGALNQCVDIANQYIVEVLYKTAIIGTNAVDFPSKASKDDYDWIPDAPLTVPQKGDLVIWKTNHIAICLYADKELPWFTSFDQNWPTGSACRKVDHSYSSVSGWLRPKKTSNELAECLSLHAKLMKEAKEKDEKIKELETLVSSQAKRVQELESENKNLIVEAEKWEAEAVKNEKIKDDWRSKYKQSQENLKVAQANRALFQKKLTECEQKQEPSNSLLKSVYDLVMKLDIYVSEIKKGS